MVRAAGRRRVGIIAAMGTKNKPGEFDCYANAEPDEPMFVLLGRDPTASFVVEFWIALRRELDDTDPKLAEAGTCARAMAEWAKSKGRDVEVVRQAVRQAVRHAMSETVTVEQMGRA